MPIDLDPELTFDDTVESLISHTARLMSGVMGYGRVWATRDILFTGKIISN